jgi:hypothetical protein
MWFWIQDFPIFVFDFDPVIAERATVSTGRITLEQPAPPGGFTVSLTSSNTALADVPETVFIPEGQTTATFEARMAPPEKEGTSNVTLAAVLGDRQAKRRVGVTLPAGGGTRPLGAATKRGAAKRDATKRDRVEGPEGGQEPEGGAEPRKGPSKRPRKGPQ